MKDMTPGIALCLVSLKWEGCFPNVLTPLGVGAVTVAPHGGLGSSQYVAKGKLGNIKC